MKKTKKTAYQIITDQVVELMEKHGSDWTRPWVSKGGVPTSISTGNPYQGVNRLVLYLSGYSDHRWGTYNAWKAAGGQVRKGESCTYVLLFKTFDKKNDKGETETHRFARAFPVFNAQQVEGAAELPAVELSEVEVHAAAERFIANTGAVIRHEGNQAFYSPVTDRITLPPRDQFLGVAEYYGTALHELTHWTGEKSRLDRLPTGVHFGEAEYAREELIAELGSTFLCSDLGVEVTPRADHAQYLASWLKALKEDSREIVRASKAAEEACKYLHELADAGRVLGVAA